MKNPLLSIIAVLAAIPCVAQEPVEIGVVSTHSVHANAAILNVHFGLGYTYEFAAARNLTILGSVWLKHEYALNGSFFDIRNIWITSPAISLEPRWYYNLERRNERGRSLYRNSGSFLAVTASCFFPSVAGTYGAKRDIVHYGFSPKWGMRRVFRNNMFLEFQTGIVILTDFSVVVAGPDINLKIGYTF